MRALLVIDLQRWFLEVGNDEKLAAVADLLENTNALIKYFEERELPILKIQTIHKVDKSTWNQWAREHDQGRLIEGTGEAEYSPEVYVAQNEIVLTKTRLSAFLRTELESILNGLQCDAVVLCGYSTDNCVGQTAIDAYELDFKVTLAGEAILGTTIEHGKLMLESLERRFGITTSTNQEIMR